MKLNNKSEMTKKTYCIKLKYTRKRTQVKNKY